MYVNLFVCTILTFYLHSTLYNSYIMYTWVMLDFVLHIIILEKKEEEKKNIRSIIIQQCNRAKSKERISKTIQKNVNYWRMKYSFTLNLISCFTVLHYIVQKWKSIEEKLFSLLLIFVFVLSYNIWLLLFDFFFISIIKGENYVGCFWIDFMVYLFASEKFCIPYFGPIL